MEIHETHKNYLTIKKADFQLLGVIEFFIHNDWMP